MSGRFSWATGCQTVVPSWSVGVASVLGRGSAIVFSPVRTYWRRTSFPSWLLTRGRQGCPDTVRRPCPVTIPGIMAWRQGEPSLRRAGRSSLTPSPIPHLLGRVGCTACTVSMSEGLVDRAVVACGRTGRCVRVNGSWLDRHACCTRRRSWCARLGWRGMALTRRVLGREAPMCPSQRVGNWPGRALEVGIRSCPLRALPECT